VKKKIFLDALMSRASQAHTFAPDALVLMPSDVVQLFEAWQRYRLTVDETGVTIQTPGTGVGAIHWPRNRS
jgi:hypothetical protein